MPASTKNSGYFVWSFNWSQSGKKARLSIKRPDFYTWPINENNLLLSSSFHAAAKSLQSCPTLCDPIDGSPPGSPIHGILQARTLEWVAISFSNARKWKVESESEVAQSCPTLRDPMDGSLPGSSVHGIFQAMVMESGAIAFSKFSYWFSINEFLFTMSALKREPSSPSLCDNSNVRMSVHQDKLVQKWHRRAKGRDLGAMGQSALLPRTMKEMHMSRSTVDYAHSGSYPKSSNQCQQNLRSCNFSSASCKANKILKAPSLSLDGKGVWGLNGYLYMYVWVPLLFT